MNFKILEGLRMRTLIMNARREVILDIPSTEWDGAVDPDKQVALQYDDRPTGRVYLAHGHAFTDRSLAWNVSVLMQTR